MLVQMDDAKTPGRLGPVPTPGQYTDEVLRGVLGYDGTTIDERRRDSAVK